MGRAQAGLQGVHLDAGVLVVDSGLLASSWPALVEAVDLVKNGEHLLLQQAALDVPVESEDLIRITHRDAPIEKLLFPPRGRTMTT